MKEVKNAWPAMREEKGSIRLMKSKLSRCPSRIFDLAISTTVLNGLHWPIESLSLRGWLAYRRHAAHCSDFNSLNLNYLSFSYVFVLFPSFKWQDPSFHNIHLIKSFRSVLLHGISYPTTAGPTWTTSFHLTTLNVSIYIIGVSETSLKCIQIELAHYLIVYDTVTWMSKNFAATEILYVTLNHFIGLEYSRVPKDLQFCIYFTVFEAP